MAWVGLDICHSAYLDVVYSHVEMVDYRDITLLDLQKPLLAECIRVCSQWLPATGVVAVSIQGYFDVVLLYHIVAYYIFHTST